VLAWSLGFGACLGGNATLLGAGGNLVSASILERAGFSVTFLSWMKAGLPLTLVTLVVANAWLLLRFCL
jgi:Na+/H+ antiporter NhaD/arsenite permease-like protein